jgi:FtsH-binding integral membrane protein
LVGLGEVSIRHGFIRKVYGILGAQLLATTVFGGVIMSWGDHLVRKSPGVVFFLLFMSLAISVGMMCVFMCKPDMMRRSPTNYFLLGAFTLAESIMVGFICTAYTQESVLIALGITCLVVVGLTAFAFQTKYDFTGFGPYLFVGCLVLMGFSFTLFVASMCGLHGPAFETIRVMYSACGALLFSAYIVYDTQLIVGGKHQFQFSLDDYAMAAISLYIDIIQLFLHLLRVFGRRRN